MIREVFLSGYCRTVDNSRMVAIEVEDGVLLDADCSYAACPYAPSCPIAQKIQEYLD